MSSKQSIGKDPKLSTDLGGSVPLKSQNNATTNGNNKSFGKSGSTVGEPSFKLGPPQMQETSVSNGNGPKAIKKKKQSEEVKQSLGA